MASPSPRKFSEKIALHNIKQAEGTAAFEQIMREVSQVSTKSAMGELEDLQGESTQSMFPRDRGRSSGGSLGNPGGGGGGGPLRSRPRLDTSPYGADRFISYLSPPDTGNWRRTISDSALHQSSMGGPPEPTLHNSGSPTPPRRGTLQQVHVYQPGMGIPDSLDMGKKQIAGLQDCRPRSSCDIPRVPGIKWC